MTDNKAREMAFEAWCKKHYLVVTKNGFSDECSVEHPVITCFNEHYDIIESQRRTIEEKDGQLKGYDDREMGMCLAIGELQERCRVKDDEIFRLNGLVETNASFRREDERLIAKYNTEIDRLQARVKELEGMQEFLYHKAKIVVFPGDNLYPIEHTLAANKDNWQAIADLITPPGEKKP